MILQDCRLEVEVRLDTLYSATEERHRQLVVQALLNPSLTPIALLDAIDALWTLVS